MRGAPDCPARATASPAHKAARTSGLANRGRPTRVNVRAAPATPPIPIAEFRTPGPAADMRRTSKASTTSKRSNIPTRVYSATISKDISRATGVFSTVRSAPSARPCSGRRTTVPRGADVTNRAVRRTPAAEQPLITISTPPAPHTARSSPLTRGPTNVASASSDPEAALPAVRSPVVREISGSRALCIGRVRVTVMDEAAAVMPTTATGASVTSATPSARKPIV